MATLALSTIGTALGGPIGGAIGSLIGHGIDQSLFGPGPRRGPRLNDLSLQTSSYGTQIPRIYGRMRVAGSVVWATELKESNDPAGGAKGQPDIIVYSYSASFAVALSSRAAKGVGRIWADGKLLRGEAGDFKVKTGFRFYSGDEDQAIDPLIASVEGIDRTTAFRGLALAVFEDLQLAEFGNRIPFLTFEVLGDETDPAIGDILSDASDGVVVSEATTNARGYAGYGANQRAALQPIVDQFSVSLFDDGDCLRTASETLSDPSDDELGCSTEAEGQARFERTQMSARAMPRSVALSYYDPDRDFQTGQMRATASTSTGVDEAIELPMVVGAGQAKALAESHIARRWAERDRLVLRLSPDLMSVEPGSLIAAEGAVWRVRQATIEGLAVRVELTRVAEDAASVPADPGTHLPAPDLVAVPTVFVVLDLPDLGMGRHDVPVLQVAACQPVAGWRQVPFEVTVGGEVLTFASSTSEAVVGTALNILADGPVGDFDEINSVEVELADGGHWLEGRDDAALANGANLAALGSELVQFGRVIPIGERRFRLERLLRGRFGSEWAMASHGSGETFAMVGAGMREIVLPPSAIGTSVSIRPMGLADESSSPMTVTVTGEAMKPPSPIDLQAEMQAGGGLLLSWIRRSRLGWSWPAGSEPPLGESTERYRITVQGSGGSLAFNASEPQLTLPAEALGGMTGAVVIDVVQVGDFADSRPATISISI